MGGCLQLGKVRGNEVGMNVKGYQEGAPCGT